MSISVIEAASVGVKTMADGTLRLTVDIEPRHAQDAFRLFGSPGTAIVLAALVAGSSPAAAPVSRPAEQPRDTALSQWVGIRCNEPEFQGWLEDAYPNQWGAGLEKSAHSVAPRITRAGVAAIAVRLICAVDSRSEFDTDPEAARRCHDRIRGPYSKHLMACGVAHA